MKLFGRDPKRKVLTEEEVGEHKKQVADIDAEVKRENFEKAIELAVRCAEDYKGNDSYGEALCRYLVGHSILCQHQKNTSPDDYLVTRIGSRDYAKAKKYLERSAEMFELLARNKEFETNRKLTCATVLIDLAMVESLARQWNAAMEACAKSLDIYEKYEFKDGMQLATRMMRNLKRKRLALIIKEWAEH